MKRVLVCIIFFSIIFTGCSSNLDVIENNDYTQIVTLYDNSELYYGKDYNVFIKLDSSFHLISPYQTSYPEISLDKKSFAYIVPIENSDKAGLYVYNVKKDGQILLQNDYNNIEITPKDAKWIDNQFLLFIADSDSINLDSWLYLLDTIQESLYVIVMSSEAEEFKNIQVDNQIVTMEIGDRDSDTKGPDKIKEYTYA